MYRKSTRRLTHLLAVLALFALFAAACGNDSGDEGSGDDGTADATTDTDDGGDADGDPAPTDDGGEEPTDDGDGDPAPTDDGGEEPTDDDDSTAPAADPEPVAGFDGETIKLGFLTDQSGSLAIVGNPLAQGSQVYWDYVNEELGGVGGRYRVELLLGDTKDDAATSVQEYQKIKDDVVLVAEILSTPPTQAVLEFLKQDDLIGVPGSLAGAWANEPNLLPTGTAYEHEMINLAEWFINESDLGSTDTVACSVRFDDLYGESTIRGLEYAAGDLGFELAVTETISRGATDFSAVVSSLDGGGCEVVYAITVAGEQHGLLAEALSQGFEPIWLGALPSYLNLLAGGAPERYANFYVALDSPGFDSTDSSGITDFLDRFGAYGEGDPNTFHLSGYLQQIGVHALLETAVANGDLGREALLETRATLGEVDVDGLAENYVYGIPGETQEPATANRIFVFDPSVPPNLLTLVAEVDSPLNEGFDL